MLTGDFREPETRLHDAIPGGNFNLSPPVSLWVSPEMSGKGTLFRKRPVIVRDTSYTGQYFGNREIRLKALSSNSSDFNHWEISSYNLLTEELIGASSQWKYYDLEFQPSMQWKSLQFDDSGWKSGISRFGYGNGNEATTISYGTDAQITSSSPATTGKISQ